MTSMFREVKLETTGHLYLHSMPGRREKLECALQEIETLKMDKVVCLAPFDEMWMKSPDYASWIRREKLSCKWVHFPIPDYGTPKDVATFYTLAAQLALDLREGLNLLLHCAAGVGRTGMLACCIAQELDEPIQHVFDTQAVPTQSQMEIVRGWNQQTQKE